MAAIRPLPLQRPGVSQELPKTNTRSKRPLSLRERAGVRESLAANSPRKRLRRFPHYAL